MRRPRSSAVLLVACAAALAGGCGAAADDDEGGPAFQGEAARVADAIEELQEAGTTRDRGTTICDERFAKSLRDRFPAGSCAEEVDLALQDADDFALQPRRVTVTGAAATAVVRSLEGGQPRERTLRLVREGRTWRIADLG